MVSIEQDKDNSPGKGVGVGLKRKGFLCALKYVKYVYQIGIFIIFVANERIKTKNDGSNKHKRI